MHPTSIQSPAFACHCRTRDELDDAGKAVLDRVLGPGGKPADLQGPVGAMLYSTRVGELQSQLNKYLRYRGGVFRAHSRSRDPHSGARSRQPV